ATAATWAAPAETAGVPESARNMPPTPQSCKAYDTMAPATPNPGFPRGIHTLAKLRSCFRHALAIPEPSCGNGVSRDVDVQILASSAPLAQAAQGRYPGLPSVPGRAPGTPPGRLKPRSRPRLRPGIVEDQCVDSVA